MPSEHEYFEEIRDATFKAATDKGHVIVLPGHNQLQLDLDRPWVATADYLDSSGRVAIVIHRQQPKAEKVLSRLLQEFCVVKWEAWKSAGGNCHVMPETPELDRLRELVSSLKSSLDDPHPGLVSWVDMYDKTMQAISDFWKGDS